MARLWIACISHTQYLPRWGLSISSPMGRQDISSGWVPDWPAIDYLDSFLFVLSDATLPGQATGDLYQAGPALVIRNTQ